MDKKKSLSLVAIAIIVAGLAAYFYYNQTQSNQEYVTVRIGYLDLPVSSLPLYVALDNQYFNDSKINVELTKFESSNPLVSALIANQIDVAVAPSTDPLLAVEQKSPGNFVIFMSHSFSSKNPFTELVVRKDSDITNLSQLNGQSIAVFPGSTAKHQLMLALQNMGYGNLTVNLVSMAPNLWASALNSSQVSAVLTYEPWGTQMQQLGLSRILVSMPFERFVLDGSPSASSAFTTTFVQDHPDTAVKIMNVFQKSIDYINTNPQDARNLMPKYSAISESVAQQTPILSWAIGSNINVTSYQKFADILYQQSVIAGNINASKIIYIPSTSSP